MWLGATGIVAVAAAVAFWMMRPQSSPLTNVSFTAGHADEFNILAVDATDKPMLNPVERFTLSPRIGTLSLPELLSRRNVVLFALDLANNLFVFVEVDDLASVWTEPFLDRGIPKHAGGKAWAVSLEEMESWTRSRNDTQAMWVWNTGRCGSTLIHRVVSTVNVASVSESCWMDQLAQARMQVPDDQLVRFLKASYAVDVHTVSKLFPDAKLFSMNPKGFGYRILDLVEKTYPSHKMMYLYRAADEVAQSFYTKLVPGMPHIVQAFLSIDLLQPIAKRLMPMQTGFGKDNIFLSKELQQLRAAGISIDISNALAEWFSLTIFDGLAYWIETATANRDSFVLRFKELSTKDVALREKIVHRLMSWILDKEPSEQQLSYALQAFAKDAQEGSAMSKGNSTKKISLSPITLNQIRAAAAKVPSAGRNDFIAPGTVFVM